MRIKEKKNLNLKNVDYRELDLEICGIPLIQVKKIKLKRKMIKDKVPYLSQEIQFQIYLVGTTMSLL